MIEGPAGGQVRPKVSACRLSGACAPSWAAAAQPFGPLYLTLRARGFSGGMLVRAPSPAHGLLENRCGRLSCLSRPRPPI